MIAEFESSILKFQGLGYKGLEFGGLEPVGLDPIGLEFESLVSVARARDLMGSDFSRLWLGLENYWAFQRLIHDPTVTHQFLCLDDYGNSNILKKWIKLSRPTLFPRLGLLSRLDRVPRSSRKNKFQRTWGGKILNFKNIVLLTI